MSRSARALAALLVAAASCRAVHVPATPATAVRLAAAGVVELEPASAGLVVSARDSRLGIANVFRVRLGEGLARAAAAELAPALRGPADGAGGAGAGAGGLHVLLRLREASVRDLAVHLTLEGEVRGLPGRGEEPWVRRYEVEGPIYWEGGSPEPDRAATIALALSARDALVLAVRELRGDLAEALAGP